MDFEAVWHGSDEVDKTTEATNAAAGRGMSEKTLFALFLRTVSPFIF